MVTKSLKSIKLALPTTWTDTEIIQDAAKAKKSLTDRRRAEVKSELVTLKDKQFPKNVESIEKAIDCLQQCIEHGVDDSKFCQTQLSALLHKDSTGINADSLRYLAFPPISEDDLKAAAEIPSFTKKTIDAKPIPPEKAKPTDVAPDPEAAMRVIQIISESIDDLRFSWLTNPKMFEGPDKEAELKGKREFAIRSTAMLLAAAQTQTGRRSNEKAELEKSIKNILIGCGFSQAAKIDLPDTRVLHDNLKAGQFMTEANVANENADFVVALLDGRYLFIECKASNTEINSRKRLNKEAVKNIQTWTDKLGSSIIGTCAIRGAFKPEYVILAQDQGAFIFWHHNLEALKEFLTPKV